ncbi:hypothetical protein D1007_03354 [Hordeum vulgare]|nr:hypothetical protein D1007_03354 [Hordeum vulgare]
MNGGRNTKTNHQAGEADRPHAADLSSFEDYCQGDNPRPKLSFHLKKRPKNSTDESEAEYHPNEDDTSEGDSFNDSLVHETEALQEFNSTPTASSNSKGLKDCKKTSQESSKKRSAAMPPGGVKPRPRKRVLADVPTSMRVTRSRKVSSQNADASAQSEQMYDPNRSLSISFDCIMNILSLDSFFEEDDDLAHCDDDNWLANGADLIAHCHDDNQRNNEAGANRAQVKFHQTTGARRYAVHYGNLGDKYLDTEPSALDLFKACHYSKKKKCYTNDVLDAITEMENKASQPTEDGQESSNTTEMATEAVAQVLAKHTKKPRFLQNVGIQHVHARSNAMNREAELVAEKRNVELQPRVDTLTNKLKESEEERARQHEEYRKRDEENRKKQSEMDAKLDLLLSLMPSRSAQG